MNGIKNLRRFIEKSRLEKAAYTLKLSIEKLEEERDKASNYMWEEYELTHHNALSCEERLLC